MQSLHRASGRSRCRLDAFGKGFPCAGCSTRSTSLALFVLSPWLVYKALTDRQVSPRPGAQAVRPARNRPCRPAARVWFHGVSVGEIHLLRQVVAAFRQRHPDWQCVVSTTTDTGFDEARKLLPRPAVFFWPFDFSWAVRPDAAPRAIQRWSCWPRASCGRISCSAAQAARRPGRRHQRPHEPAQLRPLPPARRLARPRCSAASTCSPPRRRSTPTPCARSARRRSASTSPGR